MILNILFVVLFGSLLHFTFYFLNQSPVIALFSAVNESTWEHLKLAVMPMALVALWWGIRRKAKPNNFWLSRAIAIYLAPLIIPILFYGYTTILGTNYLFLDISTFVIAVIIAEIIAHKITNQAEFSNQFNPLLKIAIILIVILFMVFTFYPPHNFLFLDPVTGTYGIATK